MSNIGVVKITFAECRSLKYTSPGFYIHMGEIEGYGNSRKVTEDKEWKLLIEEGKNIYIFRASYKDGKCSVEVAMELSTIVKDKKNKYVMYKPKRSDDERKNNKGAIETVSEIPLKYGDGDGCYDYYFILSKQWLTSERINQITREIKKGRCNRVTKIELQSENRYNPNFFNDTYSFDKKNRVIVLVDYMDLAYHLHANFFEKRNKLLQSISITAQRKTIYEDRTIEHIIYTILRSADEARKNNNAEAMEKFDEYLNCLKGKTGLTGESYYSYLKETFAKEERLYEEMADYADKLCSVLGSPEFRSAFNDYIYNGSPEEILKKGIDLYSELIFQLESTPAGAAYLHEEFEKIDIDYSNYNEFEKQKEKDKGTQDETSPVVKMFKFGKKPADGIYSIIAEYKIEVIEKAIAASKRGIYYRNKKLNFITEAVKAMELNGPGGKYVAKEYKTIIEKVKNNSIYETQEKYLKGIEELKGKITRNEVALKGCALAGNAILGARLVLHGTCFAAALQSFQELAIARPKDGWDLASSACDFIEPVSKCLEISVSTKLARKFFSKAGLTIGVVGGCIDAGLNFASANEDIAKGNRQNAYLNRCMGVCNLLMVAGVIMMNTPLAFAGAIMVAIGMTIWLICMLLDTFVFKRYDEIKVWLSHSRYGRCHLCGVQCPSPKLNTTDCHSDASAYDWTKYMTGRQPGIGLVEREMPLFLPNQYEFGKVSKPVYSKHYWFKTGKEHAEAYRNLLQEALG